MLHRFIPALALAFAAALACKLIDTPLPWMIGPLFSTAIAGMLGSGWCAPVQAREAGQWAIGTTLGLYFSASVLGVLAHYALWIVAAVAFALVLGALSGRLLRRLTGVDGVTSFFAMAPGGASEMAVQGERHGADVQRVAAAHGLRIMLVVGLIPVGLRTWVRHGLGEGMDGFVPAVTEVAYVPLLILICLTASGALLFKRTRLPNAWVIGPLLVALALTACGVHLSRLPEWMVRGGQLLIGVSLGTRFTPQFVHTAPRYLAGVAACSLVTVLVAAGFALGMAAATGLHPGAAILATSPGGIAEMALTARVLHLSVPVVTAFHVARMVSVVLLIGPLYRFFRPR